MSTSLTERRTAIQQRLDTALAPFYGYFEVTTTRSATNPRIVVTWVAVPFEDTVRVALGDLTTDEVDFNRRLLWSCGRIHDDEMNAWQTHEGAHHLEYDEYSNGPGPFDEKTLPWTTEERLIAEGETFTSACRPGNYTPCPTCGGGCRIYSTGRTLIVTPCPDCTRLGLDRQNFTGILDLDNPTHLAFYTHTIDTARAAADAAQARVDRKRARAMQAPTTLAAPHWQPLPSRDAGLLNGIPVADRVGCDYLTHADDPDRRIRCSRPARWFDPTTALRVCTHHKSN